MPVNTILIVKPKESKHCGYMMAGRPFQLKGDYEVVEAELTDDELHQLIKDEREGRITFEQIKEKYTKPE